MEGHAAVGPNADAFAPPAAIRFDFVNQILPSLIPVFSPTDSKTLSMDFEMAHTSPPETRHTSHSAGRIRAEGKLAGWRRYGGGGFDMDMRDLYDSKEVVYIKHPCLICKHHEA